MCVSIHCIRKKRIRPIGFSGYLLPFEIISIHLAGRPHWCRVSWRVQNGESTPATDTVLAERLVQS